MEQCAIRISRFAEISHNRLFLNDQCLFTAEDQSFGDFSLQAYRHFKIDYPKFHKMDNLCKLGFLTSEVLLMGMDRSVFNEDDRTALMLCNISSSLDTDVRYYEQLREGIASPAVFVYSLPNIVLGEICIRNGIKGENTFFVADTYDVATQVAYIQTLLESNVAERCIGGFVELMGESYRGLMYLAEKGNSDEEQAFNIQTIEKLLIKNEQHA